MARYVGLLRGVNVGGRNLVAMAELRALVESLGHSDVGTYIQSGNIIFTSSKPVVARSLETAIAGAFGIEIDVVLRTSADLNDVVAANPFPRADTATLHVGFMRSRPSDAALAELEARPFLPEELAIDGMNLYLHLPQGVGRSKLLAYLDRRLRVPITVRNWRTVVKLVELVGQQADGSSSRS